MGTNVKGSRLQDMEQVLNGLDRYRENGEGNSIVKDGFNIL